jgi:hypothetical protein
MPFFNKKLLFISFLIVFAMPGALAQKSGAQTLACNLRSGNIELQWMKINNAKSLKLPAKSGSAKLPNTFSVFTTNAATLKKYMMSLKKNGGEIILPAPGQMSCVNFNVMNSGTMSPQLAAKFPELVSLKGMATNDKTATVRLDYDGVNLNAEMAFGGVPYIISPWKKGTFTYYLLYKKEDSGVERKPLSE